MSLRLVEQFNKTRVLSLEEWGDQLPPDASVFDFPVTEGYVLLLSDDTKGRYSVAVINSPILPTEVSNDDIVFRSRDEKETKDKFEDYKNA